MALRRSARSLTVSPGQWIRVAVDGTDPWPMHMKIGPLAETAAFLDREGGQVYAQVRCPSLTAGTYPVVVTTPLGVTRTQITVQ